MKNKNTINNYLRKWKIDIQNKDQLTDDDIIQILKTRNPEINFGNKSFIDNIISKFPRDFPNVHKIRIYLNNIFNPSGTPSSSRLSKNFWTVRGWNGDEPHIVSEQKSHARKQSKRCVEYWINKGCSEEESKIKVKEVQQDYGSRVDYDTRVNSQWRRPEYWINKGFSEDNAKFKISELQSKYGQMQDRQKYQEFDRKAMNFFNDEYWIKRFDENTWKSEREKFFIKFNQKQVQSKWATEVINWTLSNMYDSSEHIYCLDNEFGRYIPDVGYRRWDFVDTKNKLVIELNGYYFHKSDYAVLNDSIKKEYMKSIGYAYLTIWDYAWACDPDFIKDRIKEFINENKKY